MSEQEHTPGPWRTKPMTFNQAAPIYHAVVGHGEVIAQDVEEANARLIAAAPDLLEAACDAVDSCMDPNAREKLRNAIAKAEGEDDGES